MEQYKEGQVVRVSQGHPDDDYYGIITHAQGIHTLVDGCLVGIENIRPLTNKEKGKE